MPSKKSFGKVREKNFLDKLDSCKRLFYANLLSPVTLLETVPFVFLFRADALLKKCRNQNSFFEAFTIYKQRLESNPGEIHRYLGFVMKLWKLRKIITSTCLLPPRKVQTPWSRSRYKVVQFIKIKVLHQYHIVRLCGRLLRTIFGCVPSLLPKPALCWIFFFLLSPVESWLLHYIKWGSQNCPQCSFLEALYNQF